MFSFMGCAIAVPPAHMSAIVRTESSAQQYAIGIVGHKINRQPQNLKEATALVSKLKAGGYNFSVGLAQVNQVNFKTYGLTSANMFDQCTNLYAGSHILKTCYQKHQDWSKAYSCYYSGNAVTGFKHGYVSKVIGNKSLPILSAVTAGQSTGDPIVITARGTNTTISKTPSLISRRLKSPLNQNQLQNQLF